MHSLQQNCRTLHRAASDEEARSLISVADAAVLHMPADRIAGWQQALSGMRKLPILWLCTESETPKEIEWGFTLDGILFGSMTSIEMNVALKWGLRVFQQHKRWADERDQLLQR